MARRPATHSQPSATSGYEISFPRCDLRLLFVVLASAIPAWAKDEIVTGATIRISCRLTGKGPTTWRVTLAIVDAKNPDWIVSQFANGVVRTATAENQGKFTETMERAG